jgi:N-acetylmuramoyl-L-alanine amidase
MPARRAAPEVPSAEEAMALDPEDLAATYRAVAALAEEDEGGVDGVLGCRAAAELARVLALRLPDEEEAYLDRARDHLRDASRRKALEGACESALDLARLNARDRDEPTEAYVVAYRTARRFDAESHAECIAEARRITVTLAHHAPSAARLAIIDADPDANDPSTDLVGQTATSPDSAEAHVDRWAEAHGDGRERTLTGIAVYGGGAAGASAGASDFVRAVFRFDDVTVFRRGELEPDDSLPRRLFLDFNQSALGTDVPRVVNVEGGGVTRIRTAPFEPGVTRVVFDLEGAPRHRLFVLPDPFRVVLDFDRGTRAQVVDGPRRADVIVIDPGHGGDEFGARFGGLKESNLTLDISRRVHDALRRRLPRSRVLLTRERDEIISLEERVAFANAVQADMFVSIHLNAADEPVERGGVATFVLDTTNDRQALRLAARENGTTSGQVSELSHTLADLHRAGQSRESRTLAALVQRGTLLGGRTVLSELPDRGVKSAMFYVLVGARMPAILVEASFLTQPEENLALATERYRQALSEGIAEGILRYSRGEAPPGP